jgi:uncharacterized protein
LNLSYFFLALLGLFAGTLSGLLGIGGGVILVPGLMLILKYSFIQATLVSLSVIIPTALVGVTKHYYYTKFLPLYTIAILTSFSIVGSYLGVGWAHELPISLLKKLFAVFLIFLALDMLFGWSESLRS